MARIAGNRVFESVLYMVYENILPYFERFLSKEQVLMKKNYEDLCKIMEAIEKRDSQKAQDLVNDHARYFNRMMEKREQTAQTKSVHPENMYM